MITAQEARNISSQKNKEDISEFESLIKDASENGEFMIEVDNLTKGQMAAFEKFGFSIEKRIYKPLSYIISW